jgi:hypothetical protein
MLSWSKHDCGNGSILLSHFDVLSVTWIEQWVHLFIRPMSQADALFFRRCFNRPYRAGEPKNRRWNHVYGHTDSGASEINR